MQVFCHDPDSTSSSSPTLSLKDKQCMIFFYIPASLLHSFAPYGCQVHIRNIIYSSFLVANFDRVDTFLPGVVGKQPFFGNPIAYNYNKKQC